MKKLKLFQKTYLFTMILMALIIIISHTLLYMLLPTFYMNKKEQDLENISTQLIQKLEETNENDSKSIAKDFANRYNVNIKLTVQDKSYVFEGINQTEVYIEPDSLDGGSLVIPEIEENIVLQELNNSSNQIEQNTNFFKVKANSLVNNKKFKTQDGINGSVKTMMDLQSFKEARSVVFMILPYSIGISLIISLFASYIYAKVITNPIKEICETTKDMKDLNKDAYCDINTGDEIELLAHNINSLYKTLWNTINSLKQEIENVSKSEQSKVDFLRSASHELKTPLMSIHIMLENMMLNIGKYKNHDVYLAKCKDTVVDLSNMVQEILDTSRLNTWNEQSEYKTIDVKDLLTKTIEPYKITAKYKDINMNIDYSNSLDINTDEKLLSKALSNIISNAVNYTDSGKNINIYFNNKSLVVENECEPIPMEHLERIFEAFYRAEFDRNRNTGGNGLGLYIVKQILNTLDISYSFDATENGMKFTLTFKEAL
ncbi:HAMP domain-containing sensor histidine kinase [Intestinibacter sp.]